jgi:4-amino-4-deoxy-L-arabinose transferase-like glycosyltransferase
LLVAVLLVGLALRFAWLIHAQPDPVSDYWAYFRMGENILDSGFIGVDGPSALQMPGHAVLLAGLMLISRSTWWLGAAMVVLSAIACFLVYLVALRVTSREPVALVAAALASVSPTLVLYSPVLGTEHLFVVLLLSTILLALNIREDAPYRALGAGAVAGLALLTRGEMVLYLPILMLLIWSGLRTVRPIRKLRVIALFIGALVLVISPWVVRNAVVIDPGVGLSTASGMNFYFGHRPGGYGYTAEHPWPVGDEVAANRIGWELGLAYIQDRPISILESFRDGTYGMLDAPDYALIWSTQEAVPGQPLEWRPKYVPFQGVSGMSLRMASALYLSLALAAFLTWPIWGRAMRVTMAGFLLAGWLGHTLLFFGHPRFRYSLDVLLTTLAAVTIVALWEHGRWAKSRHSAHTVAIPNEYLPS